MRRSSAKDITDRGNTESEVFPAIANQIGLGREQLTTLDRLNKKLMDEQKRAAAANVKVALKILDEQVHHEFERQDNEIEKLVRLVGGRLIFRTLSLHWDDFRAIEEACTKRLKMSPQTLGHLLDKYDSWQLAMDTCREKILQEDEKALISLLLEKCGQESKGEFVNTDLLRLRTVGFKDDNKIYSFSFDQGGPPKEVKTWGFDILWYIETSGDRTKALAQVLE